MVFGFQDHIQFQLNFIYIKPNQNECAIRAIVQKAFNSIMAQRHLVVAQHHYMQTMAFRRSPALCCSLEQT